MNKITLAAEKIMKFEKKRRKLPLKGLKVKLDLEQINIIWQQKILAVYKIREKIICYTVMAWLKHLNKNMLT